MPPDRVRGGADLPMKRLIALVAALCTSTPLLAQTQAGAAPLKIVAAENFYGDVVTQLGGSHVAVTSILSNPDQDPHLFEADPRTARAMADAQLVIYNGVDYDPWMTKLLQASPSAGRTVVVAADLVGAKVGDNPHLWYAPQTMPAVARAINLWLDQTDPAHRGEYDQRCQAFLASLVPIRSHIGTLHDRYAGKPATATEPVFGYMSDAIGLKMRNMEFQLAVMNDTEPSAKDIAGFESDLQHRRVVVLLYNVQAVSTMTRHMLTLAHDAHIPTVQVSETEPPHMSYQGWMQSQLDALDRALSAGAQ
jgi:zinc/manganese transport system substrate-binding protein